MSSRRIVLNEWVLHDLAGQKGEARQRQAESLLDKLGAESGMLAVWRGSPWMSKFALFTNRAAGPGPHLLLKSLANLVYDSARCHILENDQVLRLPPESAEKLPSDDIYLVETYLAAKADLLVTEDARLLAALHAHCPDVKVQTRDDFMRDLGIRA